MTWCTAFHLCLHIFASELVLAKSVFAGKNYTVLPLPCIILNENRRTKNWGGLGTRLTQVLVICTSAVCKVHLFKLTTDYTSFVISGLCTCCLKTSVLHSSIFFFSEAVVLIDCVRIHNQLTQGSGIAL